MKRLSPLALSMLLMFTQFASANGTAADQEAAAPTKAAQSKTLTGLTCEQGLDQNVVIKYRPTGYVTGALVNRFSKTTPFLFTDLYFRVLGAALFRNGFEKVVNAKGVFLDHVSDTDRLRAINILGGKSDDNIQLQGRIATEIWNQMVDAFRLKEVVDTKNSVGFAKKAYYTSIDDYLATRDFLLANLTYKREVIELIRLSMPFGIRMAVDNVARSDAKSIFATAAVTLTTGLLTYAATQILQMLGTPDPGVTPMIIGAAVGSVSGVATYYYTAPKTHLRKLHLQIMNWANRRTLAKQGLISKEDGESTVFIKAAFRDVEDLESQVTVDKIRAVIPLLPSGVEEKVVQDSMLLYADALAQQLTSVTALQEITTSDLAKQTRAMGEPIATLGRLLQLKGESTAHQIPDNARLAIEDYSKNVVEAFKRLRGIEEKFQALVAQYEMHEQILSAFLGQAENRLNTNAKLAIERKLQEMRTAITTVSTLQNVAMTQKNGFAEEKRALDSALSTISAAQGSNSLNTTQATNLTNALWALSNRVDAAHANEIADSEQFKTQAQSPKPLEGN